MNRHLLITALLLWFVVMCGACKKQQPITRLTGLAQGTYYSIAYIDPKQRNLQPQIDSLLDAFDLTASLWKDNSEIVRFNNSNDSLQVSETFADLFEKSQKVSIMTEGAFDVRIGALVSAYGFARSQRQDMTEAEIDSLLMVCKSRVWIDTTTSGSIFIHKETPATKIDFNAIAQGYSVDMIGKLFESLEVENYLIDVGGEILARGIKSDGSEWIVGIERPTETRDDDRQVQVAVPLRDKALVTSGSYRKYYEKDGIRFSHTIDPSTGHPVTHNTLSATSIADECWMADALATAFMVMGQERSLQWLNEHTEYCQAYFITDSLGIYATHATPSFQQLIDKLEPTK